MFEEFKIEKVFQIKTQSGRVIKTLGSEENAKSMIGLANKNLTYLKSLREKITSNEGRWKEVFEKFETEGSSSLPEDIYKYLQLSYLKYVSTALHQYEDFIFDLDFEKDVVWMKYEGTWVPGDRRECEDDDDDNGFPWLSGTTCMIESLREYWDNHIGDDPRCWSVGTPEDYNFDKFVEDIKTGRYKDDDRKHVIGCIECVLTFEDHYLIYYEID